MASLNIPDIDHKKLWRGARRLLWSLIVTFAVLVALRVYTPTGFIGSVMVLITFAAVWIVIYHLFDAIRSKVPG